MLQLEEEAKKRAPLSDSGMEQLATEEAIRKNASKLQEARVEEVARMERLKLYAQCMTIRDAQV